MARKTQRALTKILRDARVATPGLQPEFALTALADDTKLRFSGFVTIDGVVYQAATNSGKTAVFGDVDAFVRYAAGCVETSDGVYSIEIETGEILVKNLPADLEAWAEAEIVRLGVRKTAQQGVIAAIDAQLALMTGWETGNPKQQAKKAETQAQRVAVVEDIAAIDAEIARLGP